MSAQGVARWGGGIFIDGDGDVVLKNVTIAECRAEEWNLLYELPNGGGGVKVLKGSLTLIDSTIENCLAQGETFWGKIGGGALELSSGVIRAYRSRIANCAAISTKEGQSARGGTLACHKALALRPYGRLGWSGFRLRVLSGTICATRCTLRHTWGVRVGPVVLGGLCDLQLQCARLRWHCFWGGFQTWRVLCARLLYLAHARPHRRLPGNCSRWA